MNILRGIILLGLLAGGRAVAQEYTIKFATVAPEGSTWMNVMREYDAAVRKESGGRVGFRIYPQMTQGDERAVLRKIRAGQLHSGGFTGVGLGDVASQVRVLDAPFLFQSYQEVDHIYREFDAEFQRAFEEGGYVLLGWAEVGFVYVYTGAPVRKPQDLKGLKMWTWEGDPIAEAAFRALGINPIPLSITDVSTSLQTGLIDAVYTSPLACIALQWFTRVRYMIDVPLANASGAVLISKRYFDQLPVHLQEILLRNGRKYMAKLTELSRKDNKESIEELKKRGITILQAEEKDVEQYREVGRSARRSLVGRLYSGEFLDRVESTIAEFRRSHGASR